jgi:hypothetical protein
MPSLKMDSNPIITNPQCIKEIILLTLAKPSLPKKTMTHTKLNPNLNIKGHSAKFISKSKTIKKKKSKLRK